MDQLFRFSTLASILFRAPITGIGLFDASILPLLDSRLLNGLSPHLLKEVILQ